MDVKRKVNLLLLDAADTTTTRRSTTDEAIVSMDATGELEKKSLIISNG